SSTSFSFPPCCFITKNRYALLRKSSNGAIIHPRAIFVNLKYIFIRSRPARFPGSSGSYLNLFSSLPAYPATESLLLRSQTARQLNLRYLPSMSTASGLPAAPPGLRPCSDCFHFHPGSRESFLRFQESACP